MLIVEVRIPLLEKKFTEATGRLLLGLKSLSMIYESKALGRRRNIYSEFL